MLSTQTRLKVEFLCSRIEQCQPIGLAEMTWLQKWADKHRTVYDMVLRARRRAVRSGPAPEGSMDAFLDDLNIGDPDPESQLSSDCNIDELVDFFRAPDWMRRD